MGCHNVLKNMPLQGKPANFHLLASKSPRTQRSWVGGSSGACSWCVPFSFRGFRCAKQIWWPPLGQAWASPLEHTIAAATRGVQEELAIRHRADSCLLLVDCHPRFPCDVASPPQPATDGSYGEQGRCVYSTVMSALACALAKRRFD
jgi:hypothetical protein